MLLIALLTVFAQEDPALEPTVDASELQTVEASESGFPEKTVDPVMEKEVEPIGSFTLEDRPGKHIFPEFDFQMVPIVALGSHTPLNSNRPIRYNGIFGLGMRASYAKQQPVGYWGGTAASWSGMPGNKRSGWEVRFGSVFGPEFSTSASPLRVSFTVYSGAEFIIDRYRQYCRPYGTAFQFSLPLMARVRLSILILEGGVAPSWFLSAKFRDSVDWSVSDIKGFGDEFEIRGAIGIRVKKVRLGLNMRTRVATFGDQTWLGIGMSYYGAG